MNSEGSPKTEESSDAPRSTARIGHTRGVPIRLAAPGRVLASAESARVASALQQHFELVWRTLRRFGVAPAALDDASQHVFLTLAARLAEVLSGQERAFLVGVCVRVAANERRLRARSREVPEELEPVDAEGLTPEELLDWKQRRERLDRALALLSLEQRTVFVLYELEGFSLPEIARCLAIPLGTATSRLGRARQAFEASLETSLGQGEEP